MFVVSVHARDVYLTLYDEWQLNPNKSIAASEQTHSDTVNAPLVNEDFISCLESEDRPNPAATTSSVSPTHLGGTDSQY